MTCLHKGSSVVHLHIILLYNADCTIKFILNGLFGG